MAFFERKEYRLLKTLDILDRITRTPTHLYHIYYVMIYSRKVGSIPFQDLKDILNFSTDEMHNFKRRVTTHPELKHYFEIISLNHKKKLLKITEKGLSFLNELEGEIFVK